MKTGWIKIHRSVMDWQWYTESGVKEVFFHILLKTNTEPKKWRETMIERGEHITSIANMAEELMMSPDKIRGALKKLEASGEIKRYPTNKYTKIKVINFNKYQKKERSKETC